MNHTWWKIWPKIVDDISCCDAEDLENMRHGITEMAHCAGCEEVDGDDVTKMSHSHREEKLTNEGRSCDTG
jgi:hypothetical protein